LTRVRRSRAARKACLLLLLAVAFLPFGVPRWLNHDAPPVGSHADGDVSALCRDHGGMPRTTPKARSFCTVRYGRQDYVMDAITTAGFDEDTAQYQRQGCAEARREERASNAPRSRRRSFVYHPTTGVCERRG
jgi:hypothetical protein